VPPSASNGMTVKIDKAGRIVLPKPVRERLRLREGSEPELERALRRVDPETDRAASAGLSTEILKRFAAEVMSAVL
jgi:AbrB family looped-hinge helix DNA binding protein